MKLNKPNFWAGGVSIKDSWWKFVLLIISLIVIVNVKCSIYFDEELQNILVINYFDKE